MLFGNPNRLILRLRNGEWLGREAVLIYNHHHLGNFVQALICYTACMPVIKLGKAEMYTYENNFHLLPLETQEIRDLYIGKRTD